MNIACDARALIGPRTGVGEWTVRVMSGLAEGFGHHIQLAASKPLHRDDELNRGGITTMPVPRVPWPGTLWLQTTLPRLVSRIGADVFVGSLAIVPRGLSVPAVAMVHDLTPRTHPGRHTLANRFCFNAYIESSLEAAAAVVAGSDATRSELVRLFPEVGHKLERIGYGVDAFFSPPEAGDDGRAIRERVSGGRPYILHLGTLEPRKGLVELITAWDRLMRYTAEVPDLVLAGKTGWGVARIESALAGVGRPDRVHRLGYVDRALGRDLLRHTALFVLASEAEGFGLPLAEAIACHAPCVASDIAALRESGGSAPLFAPPCDALALADAIRAALVPERNAELRDRSKTEAGRLGWDRVVTAWDGLLGRVLRNAPATT